MNLIYAPTNEIVASLDFNQLTVIDMAALGLSWARFNIEAVADSTVDSITFSPNGHVETIRPFHYCGGKVSDLKECPDLTTGKVITVTASVSGMPDVTVTFRIDEVPPITLPPVSVPPDQKIFREIDNVVMMEAEHASSGVVAPWKFETELIAYCCSKYVGEGYVRFDGNEVTGGPSDGVMSYFFYIENGGRYTLKLRSNKLHADNTLSNDCYTRMVGYEGYQGGVVKTYQSANAGYWNWFTKHEVVHGTDTRIPEYDLEGGKVYELQISGRSRGFIIDRVVLYRSEVVEQTIVEKASYPESPFVYNVISGPVSPPVQAPVSPGCGTPKVRSVDFVLITL